MFKEKIDSIPANCFNYGDYHDGFYQCRDEDSMIAGKADAYIERLEYYIRKMAGDDILQEIKEEVGV